VKPDAPHTVNAETIVSKCGWSPFEGHTFRWDITHTWVNGHTVYKNGMFDEHIMGQRLTFA
jgi:dihydroorotase